ncbi:ABC transporter substrate-binding protein [Halomarina oriensis]|uniref:ABC transporter substrate-binding protein n=1 Tax=Halomarina oriensis TaxID=671145 RepID=A0A6B0GW47_9EURY|nr:ABC transporter substrate-binding protein [Halomarina oriensis]MWG36803.1 ABC transporter substrate-binding protein [Halomarina oriensis]
MHESRDDPTGPTRRQYLLGGTAALSGLLAGCASGGSGSVGNETTGQQPTESDTATATDATATEATTEPSGPYSATLAPAGEVTFDGVPESVFTVFSQYPDMLVALGHGDAVNAMYVPEMAGTTMNNYYERLDGVSFDWEDLPDPLANGLAKELLYDLDSDVHLADPAWASTQQNWASADVDEITESVGPWFGNFYSGTNAEAPEGYADAYRYYTLWDLFGHVADVFQERDRYEALNAVHENLLATIEEGLPPQSERPTAVRVTFTGDQFYTYHLNDPGYWLADTRPLGANDAFAERDWQQLWGTVGMEAMAEADPDVVLHLWGMTPNYDMAEVRQSLAAHPIGGDLSAVQNDRVYAQGMRYQGPLMNLFQLEATAKQLYPERFGAWPGYEAGDPYPEIPEGEQLFDREQVASVVRGDGR